MYNFTFNQLQYFYKLAQTLNYSRAAEQLLISQPALSKQISDLEKIMGVKLFQKNGRNISLTPAGNELVIHVTKILKDVNNTENAINKFKNEQVANMKIGVAGIQGVYRLVDGFNNDNENIHIQISELATNEIIDKLQNRELDAGITILPVDDSSIDTEVLFDSYIFAVVAEDNPYFQNKTEATLSELAQFSIAIISRKFYVRRLLDSAFQNKLIIPKYDFELNNYDSCLRLVKGSSRITFIHHSDSEVNEIEGVKLIKISDHLPTIFQGVIHLKSLDLNPKFKDLIDKIKEQFQGDVDHDKINEHKKRSY